MTRMDNPRKSGRRDFLKLGVATGLSAAIPGAALTVDPDRPPAPFAAPPMERVRIGFVGVGGMGTVHVRNLLQIEGAQIRAVCDIVEDKVTRALKLVRRGMLGELLHAECGYLHDLRSIKFSTTGEGLWRRAHAMRRNGNLYPTHGLGPVAQVMDINRGDRFDYLVSMSSNSRGLKLYAAEHFPPDDPRRRENFVLGDVNVSLIRTVNGKTIYIAHECDNPRPYSRINLVQGTRGVVCGYPDRVHIEGRSGEQWEPLEKYRDEFEHPLWRAEQIRTAKGGHGGMDFLEDTRLIQNLRHGVPLDSDVYDAASWSVVCALTEQSVARRSRPIDLHDFTRGRWKTAEPIGIITTQA